jgi:hypothetical protein
MLAYSNNIFSKKSTNSSMHPPYCLFLLAHINPLLHCDYQTLQKVLKKGKQQEDTSMND